MNIIQKTLFKTNKTREKKQFYIIQVLQDKITHKYTTYNRKGIFPNYGKGWRYDIYSFNDVLLNYYDIINKYTKEGFEEIKISDFIKTRQN